jgi:hypothetical protein
MSKFSVDYNGLENVLYKKSYKLSEVQDRIEKVAFDVVRFKDSDKRSLLWQIQSADDGDYIVAMYDENDGDVIKEASLSADNWEVSLSKNSFDLQFYYKGEPVIKVASHKLGISKEEISSVPSYLPKKLSENKKLASSLLNLLGEPAKKVILSKYPELA